MRFAMCTISNIKYFYISKPSTLFHLYVQDSILLVVVTFSCQVPTEKSVFLTVLPN